MLSKHLTHLAYLLSVCERSDLTRASHHAKHLPKLGGRGAYPGRREGLGRFANRLLFFFLIEFVIKEVVRGGEETLKSQNSY